jgi:transposase
VTSQTVDKVLLKREGLFYFIDMIEKHSSQQTALEFISIDELVPKEHLLRKISRSIDFGFIREKVSAYYCADNGRPGIDPVILFKMLFIGYLFGIRSERQLTKEIEVNVAYRWFLGLGFRDAVPHHSTLSQNRRRRFNQSDVYQQIFDEIVLLAARRGMVDGKTLYTDSTHLKANANKNKYTQQLVTKSTRDYLDELDKDIDADRTAHGKRPMKSTVREVEQKETKISTTDPQSGYMVRDNKPKGFFYLDHRTVDGKHSIITDTHVTAGNVHDSIPYLSRLDRQRERFGFSVEAVGLDAGYYTASICKGLSQRNIYGVIGYSRPVHRKGYLHKREYCYDSATDSYQCPHGHTLTYRTTTRIGYQEYVSDPTVCSMCPDQPRCCPSADHKKVLTRHVWQAHKEMVNQHRLEDRGKGIYARRKETVERSFADAKQLHGYRYARMRGLSKVMEQCLLTAVAQNVKKIALLLCGKGRPFLPFWRINAGITVLVTPAW